MNIRSELRARMTAAGKVAFGACLIVGHASIAQELASEKASIEGEDRSVIQDIVITAQRRSENLQSVPIAVSAVDASALEDAGIDDTLGLASKIPSLQVNFAGALPQTYLRGVGTRLAPPGLEPSIATYSDDRYIGSPTATVFSLLDVERVEVVKGPQGVLFGRNATGGAIRVISRQPTDEFEGTVMAGYGSDNAYEARGTLNIPVSDTLATRVTAAHLRRDGYATNLFAGGRRDLDDRDLLAARGSMRWDITPALTMRAMLEYSRQDDTAGQDNIALAPLNLNTAIALGGSTGTRPGEVATAQTGGIEQDEISAQLRFDLNLDRFTVSSITTWADMDSHFAYDVDGTSTVFNDTFDYGTLQDTVTQEFQIVSNEGGRFEWLAGLYLLDADGRVNVLVRTPAVISVGGTQFVDTESIAAFGQGTWSLSDQFSLIVGGRYNYEEKTLRVELDAGMPNFVNTALLPYSDSVDFTEFTPKAVLQWDYTDRGMAYVSYSRGFKSGGFNFPAVAQPVLRPEILDSYEIGWKADLLDRTLRASVAAFYYDYEDLQVSRAAASATGVVSVATENAANSTMKGAELDFTWQASTRLSVGAAISYLDGEYTDYTASARVFRADTPTPGTGLGTVTIPFNADGYNMLRAPELSWNLGVTYDFLLGSGRLPVSLNYAYKSEFDFDIVASANTAALRHPSYGLLSGRVSWMPASEKWQLSAFATNITDEEYFDDVSIVGNGLRASYGEPLAYGLEVEFRF